MDFQALQTRLQDRTLDTSTDFGVGGDKNKQCINDGLRDLYDRVKNSTKVAKYFRKPKTEINIVNKVATLPLDFDTIGIVSIFDFSTESDIELSDGRVYDFEVRGRRGEKKIYIGDIGYSKLYITYAPIQEDLVDDTDTSILPDELDDSIVDFAEFYYYRSQRDLPMAADALGLAQELLEQRISTLG